MQTIGAPYSNYVYALCKEVVYERCAPTWYAIFMIANLLLHLYKDASPHKCACKNYKPKDDEHQISKQREADVLRINYRYLGDKVQRVLFLRDNERLMYQQIKLNVETLQ